MGEHEITVPGPLLDEAGRLREPGWARAPLLDANLERAGGALRRALRLKRWDYYGIWSDELYAAVALAHLGYAGLVFAYVVDFASGRVVERTRRRPLGAGVFLPRSSESGDIAFAGRAVQLEIAIGEGGRSLWLRWDGFDGEAPLEIDVELGLAADHESVVTATPLPESGFYYNRKINAMPVSGGLRWGERRLRLRPERALGQLDWGRGIWPWRSHWVWASANGFGAAPSRVGARLGLNLGALGDPSHGSENAIVVDGRLHKLGAVAIDCDPRDLRKPWRFRDCEGRLEVELVPAVERIARTRGLVRSEVHQLFGRFSGRAVLDDGRELALADLPGFAEEHHARW
jgi:hypothetical protein